MIQSNIYLCIVPVTLIAMVLRLARYPGVNLVKVSNLNKVSRVRGRRVLPAIISDNYAIMLQLLLLLWQMICHRCLATFFIAVYMS